MSGEFVACEACAAKPGAPTLCSSCLSNRRAIGSWRNHAETAIENADHWEGERNDLCLKFEHLVHEAIMAATKPWEKLADLQNRSMVIMAGDREKGGFVQCSTCEHPVICATLRVEKQPCWNPPGKFDHCPDSTTFQGTPKRTGFGFECRIPGCFATATNYEPTGSDQVTLCGPHYNQVFEGVDEPGS